MLKISVWTLRLIRMKEFVDNIAGCISYVAVEVQVRSIEWFVGQEDVYRVSGDRYRCGTIEKSAPHYHRGMSVQPQFGRRVVPISARIEVTKLYPAQNFIKRAVLLIHLVFCKRVIDELFAVVSIYSVIAFG